MRKKLIYLASLIGATLAILIGAITINSDQVQMLGDVAKSDDSKIQRYDYNINLDWFEATNRNSWGIPVYGNYQIYCAQPGAQLHYAGSINYQTAIDTVDNSPYTRTGSSSRHASRPHKGDLTYPVYSASERGTLSPAAAYIASIKMSTQEAADFWQKLNGMTDEEIEEFWDKLAGEATTGEDFGNINEDLSNLEKQEFWLWQEKQKAFWNLRDSGLDDGLITGSKNSAHDGPSIYDQEAIDYNTYNSQVDGVGLKATDTTNLYDTETIYNRNNGKLTVGPYKLNYTNGIYGNIAFSGISNMVIYGYNYNYELVRNDIKIESFLLKDSATGVWGNAVTPEYFTPDDTNYVDRTKQVYPAPDQEFYIVFSDPNKDVFSYSRRVKYIEIKVEFKYMLADGEYQKMDGVRYEVKYRCEKRHISHDSDESCRYRHKEYAYLTEHAQQEIMLVDGVRTITTEEVTIKYTFPTSGDDDDDGGGHDDDEEVDMEIGGYVWEDAVENKESIANGVKDESDIPLKNIKVTLYEENGTLATLKTNVYENDLTEAEILHRVNPTYTDENGYYEFKGVDVDKKYYVVFEYNGLTYMPTEYLNTANKQYNSVQEMVKANEYNTENWRITSKGIEAAGDRDNFDQKFEEIGSYPENYKTDDSLGEVNSQYNATYSNLQLMGYTLNANGKYEKTGEQLVDGYLYDENGYQTEEYSQGIISTKIREYVVNNRIFPDANGIHDIYEEIAGGDDEVWRMLQFIEDSKITAYTGSVQNEARDLFPVYDYFIVNDPVNGVYDFTSDVRDGIRYYPIYDGQYYINLGLWRRQESDLALRKDAYKATLKINNKTMVYDYDKRTTGDDYWEISVRVSDYNAYYNAQYNRDIYKSDYDYKTVQGFGEGHNGLPLEVYVTYKITIRNQSQTILNQIKEVVDYYDDEYTYRKDLSWVTFDNNRVSDEEYYNAMVNEDVSNKWISNAKNVNSSDDSKYNDSTESNLNGYKAVYIRGLENYKLSSGESAYIYLTFQVNRNNNGQLINDNDGDSKYNIAEINGFKTYYDDDTDLPNGVTKDSDDIAGLLDVDSNPGNLENKDIQGDKYERNFEDDTDRAPGFNLIVNADDIRKANGTVWEDQRNKTVGNSNNSEDALIGDGIRQDDEIGIKGVTVQLVEKCSDGTEYVWQTTSTDENGKYSFEGYIPGDYVIRFFYGDTKQTALTTNDGGANQNSYNGQDYKSTLYQTGINEDGQYVGIDQNGVTDETGRYQGYIDTENQNVSGTYNGELNSPTPTNTTYGYDISKADADSTNYSDAKDLWTVSNRNNVVIKGPANNATNLQGRDAVINYSDNDITNHIAEVLASPYRKPSYNGTEYSAEEMNALYNELIQNTHMTAETGIIVVEFEYDRQETDGYDNINNNVATGAGSSSNTNGTYVLNNIDFGLVERPKSQLEIDKSITNVQVTLANNTILFDINEEANNAIWQDHKEYSIDEKKINSNDKNIKFDNGEIGMYEEYYAQKNKHRYSYRDEIDKIVRNTDKGLIQLTMDEELMHGATIQITYAVKITNVGEVDYVDDATKDFYYKGNTTGTHVSTTTTDQVIDYVANNLQFNGNNQINIENGWNSITIDNLTNNSDVNADLANKKLTNNIAKYNNVIQTESFNTSALKPGQEVTKTLILSQLITPENTDDDLTYTNMVEIAKTTNEVGRRMAYSVVGNQDPTSSDASEVDSNVAERVIILPPFGNAHIYYIIGAVIASVTILGVGIVLIKKKVLKK